MHSISGQQFPLTVRGVAQRLVSIDDALFPVNHELHPICVRDSVALHLLEL